MNNIIKEYLELVDGELCFKKYTGNKTSGMKAGWTTSNGYRWTQVRGVAIAVHRAVWILEHGDIDDSLEIDHIDRDRCNNNISNLRLVSKEINSKNRSLNKNSSTGKKGITKSHGKFMVRVNENKKRRSIGQFNTIDEAIEARNKKYAELGYTIPEGY